MATPIRSRPKGYWQRAPLVGKLYFLAVVALGIYWIYSYQRFQNYDFLAHTYIRDIHDFDCKLRKVDQRGGFPCLDAWDAVYDCAISIPADSIFHPSYVTFLEVEYSCRKWSDGAIQCDAGSLYPEKKGEPPYVAAIEKPPDSMVVIISCSSCASLSSD